MKTFDEARKSCHEASLQVQEAERRLRLARKVHEMARLELVRSWVRGALGRGLMTRDIVLITEDDGTFDGCAAFPPGRASVVPDELRASSVEVDWRDQLPVGVEVYIPEIGTFSRSRA